MALPAVTLSPFFFTAAIPRTIGREPMASLRSAAPAPMGGGAAKAAIGFLRRLRAATNARVDHAVLRMQVRTVGNKDVEPLNVRLETQTD